MSWIKSEDKELKTFVQNRVLEIRGNVKPENWFYCKTNENPADLVTRSDNDIRNPLWFEGPAFLKLSETRITKHFLPEDLDFEFKKEIKHIRT